MIRITLLTGYGRFFGQTRKPWLSMDTGALIEQLGQLGIEAEEHGFHEVVNSTQDLTRDVVFYTFSQRENLRLYIHDLVSALQDSGKTVIPSYELLRCHENKGFAQIHAQRTEISSLWSIYLSSKRELPSYQINYPVVLKTRQGSNSRGVFLIAAETELLRRIRKLERGAPLPMKLDFLRRRLLRNSKVFPHYPGLTGKQDTDAYIDYKTPEIPFILQEFVPDLKYDHRVIIFGERYYVSKRLTRKGDFRASGAKKFTFSTVPDPALLNYAREIYEKLDTPFLSLDVGTREGGFCLFEFQALHFGINVIVKAEGYFTARNGDWTFVKENLPVESLIARGLATYLKKKGQA
ncbi:MAG: hypothetical protein K0B87_03310 [Candidatus Syntrophosphaera sp.]|nr:hypothetical protein [Candidatus Syntrophosphaera sp.]